MDSQAVFSLETLTELSKSRRNWKPEQFSSTHTTKLMWRLHLGALNKVALAKIWDVKLSMNTQKQNALQLNFNYFGLILFNAPENALKFFLNFSFIE